MRTLSTRAIAKLLFILCIGPLALSACGGDDNSAPKVSAAKSTITAAPTTVTADGSAIAAITVTLLDTQGKPFSGNADVEINADPCTQCNLSYSNDNGTITGAISSAAAEDIVLGFTVNGESSPSMATVHFVAPPPPEPNILFIVMDDVGVDAVDTMGYGGANPPATPTLDSIADAGVRFRNTWSMPECTPSRAMFFEGRYPFRTNILNVIVDLTLANSQLSPYEYLTPKLLHNKGYTSALFGKFHMGGPDNNPFGNGAPGNLGWDYFYGFIEGAPYPIDTTAGGVAASGTYSCGFVPDASQPGGTNVGACYTDNGNTCTAMSKNDTGIAPGLACLQSGGILVPNAACQASAPTNLDFDTMNAYYVSPVVINQRNGANVTVTQVPPADTRARIYRTTLETDAAIDWINSRPAGQPWMATVSYSAIHAPYQQPPMALLPDGTSDNSALNCAKVQGQRTLTSQMLEALDHGMKRLLTKTGLATLNDDGSLDYHPDATNTWIVVVGDNGSYAPVVRAPFDPVRAKGFVYQTGVWVPLVVSGPGVVAPGRSENAMLNIADLYNLFAKIAGIDVDKTVPSSHILDAKPVMPYLTHSNQAEIRTTNFTEMGQSLTPNGEKARPCVVALGPSKTCLQVFPNQQVCEMENGVWYGPGSGACNSAQGCGDCCDVRAYEAQNGVNISLLADTAKAIRNDDYKLVVSNYPACIQPSTQYEFYRINEATPVPRLDTKANNLLDSPTLPPQGLTDEELENFNTLQADLQELDDSQPSCPGDGNEDMLVNQEDLDNWEHYSQVPPDPDTGLNSSWYDLNLDGLTNDADKAIIEAHLGANCLETSSDSRLDTSFRN